RGLRCPATPPTRIGPWSTAATICTCCPESGSIRGSAPWPTPPTYQPVPSRGKGSGHSSAWPRGTQAAPGSGRGVEEIRAQDILRLQVELEAVGDLSHIMPAAFTPDDGAGARGAEVVLETLELVG